MKRILKRRQCTIIKMTRGINMDIRAIVCDVDGTLLTSKQVVDERTVAAIRKA